MFVATPIAAKKTAGKKALSAPTKTINTEREQQFTYYWYAAKQALTEQRYADAYLLLGFCNSIKPNDGQVLSSLGAIYTGMEQKERAFEAYKKAYETDPKDQWFKYSAVLIDRHEPGDLEEAIRVLEHAQNLNPKDDNLQEKLCLLYITKGEYKKALKTQDRIDELRGYDAYSALTRYRIYGYWGKPKKALEALDKYIEIDPINVRFLIFRAETMQQTKAKPEEIFAIYEKIIHLEPMNLSVLNNYAYYLATHGGDIKKAERMSEITIKESPNNPVYLDTYGWILGLQGQFSLAIYYLDKAYNTAYYIRSDELPIIKQHLEEVRRAQDKYFEELKKDEDKNKELRRAAGWEY